MTSGRPRVVGIDPSITATGIALPDGTCHTVGRAGVSKLGLAARGIAVRTVAGAVVALAPPGAVDLVAIEGLGGVPGMFGLLGERHFLWWLLVSHYLDNGVPVLSVNPTTLHGYATGNGNANKKEVLAAARELFPQYGIRRGDDNQADAVSLAAIGCRHLGFPLEDAVPNARRMRFMDKVEPAHAGTP